MLPLSFFPFKIIVPILLFIILFIDPDKEDSGWVGEWVGSYGRGLRRGNRLEHVNFPTWKLLLQRRKISSKAENGLGMGEGREGEEVSDYQRIQFPSPGKVCPWKM